MILSNRNIFARCFGWCLPHNFRFPRIFHLPPNLDLDIAIDMGFMWKWVYSPEIQWFCLVQPPSSLAKLFLLVMPPCLLVKPPLWWNRQCFSWLDHMTIVATILFVASTTIFDWWFHHHSPTRSQVCLGMSSAPWLAMASVIAARWWRATLRPQGDVALFVGWMIVGWYS